ATMSTAKILTLWADERVDEEAVRILRKSSLDIPVPMDSSGQKDIKTLVNAFIEMDNALGLAAPQIGISKRIVVFRNKGFGERGQISGGNNYEVLINPRITQARGEKVSASEGCLSCPEINVEVSRFPEIKVRAYDLTGRKINKRYTDFLARIVQHEIDHLEGKLIVDYGGTVSFPRKREEFFTSLFYKTGEAGNV
ncbi:MAG: peptide deformylase, partial [Syntrophales bacterium]|nr:peptide deformylase [Syntrophales bacterium]